MKDIKFNQKIKDQKLIHDCTELFLIKNLILINVLNNYYIYIYL